MTKTCLTMCIVLLCTICSATQFLNGAYAQYDSSAGAVANIYTLKTNSQMNRWRAILHAVLQTNRWRNYD